MPSTHHQSVVEVPSYHVTTLKLAAWTYPRLGNYYTDTHSYISFLISIMMDSPCSPSNRLAGQGSGVQCTSQLYTLLISNYLHPQYWWKLLQLFTDIIICLFNWNADNHNNHKNKQIIITTTIAMMWQPQFSSLPAQGASEPWDSQPEQKKKEKGKWPEWDYQTRTVRLLITNTLHSTCHDLYLKSSPLV